MGGCFGRRVVAAIGFTASASLAHAGTLNVDQGDPNCTDGGSGAAGAPYCTIGAAKSDAVAGDTVLVKPGVYAEKVKITQSGTASAPIVFTADGAVTVSGQANGFDVSGGNWITIQGFTIANTTSHAVRISGTSNVTLADSDIVNSGDRGLYITTTSDVTISGNTIEDSASYGIYAKDSSALTITGNLVAGSGHPTSSGKRKGVYVNNVADSTIVGNDVEFNSDSGIYLVNGSTRVVIKNNTARENAREYVRAAPGIEIRSSTDNTVESNRTFENEDTGIQLYTGAHDNLVVNNLTFNNGDHGIDTLHATGNRHIGNTVYGNTTSGLNVEGDSTGTLIANNVSVDNAINSPRTSGNIRVDAASTAGTVANYNLVYLTAPGAMYTWQTVEYDSLSDLHAVHPEVEVNGIEAAPQFSDELAGDFRLDDGSPAIDSADSGASGASSMDLEGNPRFDDSGVTNTGTGPRDYDDRGAYEKQSTGGPPANTAPVIVSGPTATPNPVSSTETTQISVNATDADGHPLTYTWLPPLAGGTISGSGASVTYTPPAVTAPETFTVSVQISDGFGGLVGGSVDVDVTPPPGEQTIAVVPVADTWVGEQAPDQTHGSSSKLEVDDSPIEIAYLRFVVTGVTPSITSARLHLEVVNPSSSGGSVHTVSDNAWQEATLTYNTRPPVGPVLDTLGIVEVGQTVEFDVTSAIVGDGTYSFAIDSDDNNGVDYIPREGSSGSPELVITFAP